MNIYVNGEMLKDILGWELHMKQQWRLVDYDVMGIAVLENNQGGTHYLDTDFAVRMVGKGRDIPAVDNIHPLEWYKILGFKGDMWLSAIQLYHRHNVVVYTIRTSNSGVNIAIIGPDGRERVYPYQTSQTLLALQELLREFDEVNL